MNGVQKECAKKVAAEEYLRKHHIVELFEDICTAIAYKKPENVKEFIIEQLELRKTHGIHVPVFTDQEVENIFRLYDLKQEGTISRFKCKEALKSMASTQKQMVISDEMQEIPNKVTFEEFKVLCKKALGVGQ